jgi:PAS domain S-box-containing protein
MAESETRYRSLFENMLDGFAYCEMLFDDRGRPTDFVYLAVNSSFGSLTGLADVVGKRFTEVIPGGKDSQPELFERYGRVVLTGKPERFEIEIKALGMWFSISAYGAGKRCFVATFDNVTERKQAEEALLFKTALLEAQTETTIDGILVVNESDHIVLANRPSVVTPKPANGGQGKTGQWKRPGTQLFYPAASCGGKSIFVRQLRGPHLRT